MAVQWNKFTIKVQEAVEAAQAVASEYGHQALDVEHLLVALIRQEGGVIRPLLAKLGASPEAVSAEAIEKLKKMPQVSGGGLGQLYLTPRLNKTLENAAKEAEHLRDEYISAEHILLAMCEDSEAPYLKKLGITRDAVLKVLVEIRGPAHNGPLMSKDIRRRFAAAGAGHGPARLAHFAWLPHLHKPLWSNAL